MSVKLNENPDKPDIQLEQEFDYKVEYLDDYEEEE